MYVGTKHRVSTYGLKDQEIPRIGKNGKQSLRTSTRELVWVPGCPTFRNPGATSLKGSGERKNLFFPKRNFNVMRNLMTFFIMQQSYSGIIADCQFVDVSSILICCSNRFLSKYIGKTSKKWQIPNPLWSRDSTIT